MLADAYDAQALELEVLRACLPVHGRSSVLLLRLLGRALGEGPAAAQALAAAEGGSRSCGSKWSVLATGEGAPAGAGSSSTSRRQQELRQQVKRVSTG